MNLRHKPLFLLVTLGFLCLTNTAARAGQLQVMDVSPLPNTTAMLGTTVSINFNMPVSPGTINTASFRVFGRQSGSVPGLFTFSNGNRRVTFTRSQPFFAGDMVFVDLSHNIRATDNSPLRAAGYAFSFRTVTGPSSLTFQEIDVMSNRINNIQTRIYGAAASDLNEDGYLDLTTINEVSADVRIFLNLADGSGLYDDFLTPQAIGVEASPHESADFNNDGHSDIGIVAVESHSVWVLLGAGDGTFYSITEIPVGAFPHGIAILDVDGDADPDIVNSNNGSNNLSLLINNGAGVFGATTYFDSGAFREYGLSAADMNGDGISDVVVTARDGQEIVTMLGDGDGTFTPAGSPTSSGGVTWVVSLGDVNGDAILDASVANAQSNNGAILIGNGDGTFGPPDIMNTGAHTPSTDLGDLDGDGDLDWVLSSYGGGFWRIYTNDGTGDFTFNQEISAPANPSCAIILDFDNDRDLDLALSDEIADVVVLMKNLGAPAGIDDSPGDAAGDAAGDASLTPTLRLYENAPNPFGDGTLIRFELAHPGEVTLQVFDASGRNVASRALMGLAAGINAIPFHARGADGQPLSNGVYNYILENGRLSRSGRLVVLR